MFLTSITKTGSENVRVEKNDYPGCTFKRKMVDEGVGGGKRNETREEEREVEKF